MIELLQPFIVASWSGHRDDSKIPTAVREVWRNKFDGRGIGRGFGNGFGERQSNVDLAVLDSEGRLVRSFDGFKRPDPGRFSIGRKRESLAQYTARELREASAELDLTEAPWKEHAVKLPDLEGSGIRVFVRLMDERMRAYRAPVVEVVPLEDDDWKPLAYPEKQRTIQASTLKKWLSQVYPPGIMERTDPRTKLVYEIKTTEGELSLTPAGSDGEQRYALLRGKVRLTDEGPGDFGYEGTLEVVLTYAASGSKVGSLRGLFDGSYSRYDRMHDRTRRIPLRAAFESLPGVKQHRDTASRIERPQQASAVAGSE